MKVPGLSRGAAFALAGTVGLAVGFSLFAEARLQSEALLTSRRLAAHASGGDGATTAVQECPTKPEGKATLDLTPTVNAAVEFQCGGDTLLRPEYKEPLQIYSYDPTGKTCLTTNAEALATAFTGATLTKKEAQGGSRAGGKSPVYAFKYTTEPSEDKHLCYTCNTATGSSGKDVRQGPGEQAPEGTLACTVYIKVPKKEQEKTTTTSSTPAPTTSSGAHAMPAAIFSAVGGLLAVVLRI